MTYLTDELEGRRTGGQRPAGLLVCSFEELAAALWCLAQAGEIKLLTPFVLSPDTARDLAELLIEEIKTAGSIYCPRCRAERHREAREAIALLQRELDALTPGPTALHAV